MTKGRPRVHVQRTLADYPPPTPQPTPCRLWQGRTEHGYGVRADGKRMHVWVWEQINGPVPRGKQVNHRCDNPPCYRYDHLWLGTQAENMADMTAKGRRVPFARSGRQKLTEDQVRAIRADARPRQEVAAEYRISQKQVTNIRRRKQWRHLDG